MRTAAAATLLLAAAAAAQPVYRCGPDGRAYSDQPCPTGVAVDVADPRSPGQRQQALEVAAYEQRLAETLSQERRQRERAASRQGAAHIGPTRGASAPEAAPRPKAPRKADARRARDDARMSPPLKAFAPAA